MINILLVEDHPILRVGLKVVLEQAGNINVTGEANNGTEAIRFAEKMSFDLIIMDVNMPGMDGIQAVKTIKEKNPEVKILMYSGNEDNEVVVNAIKAGADGYLFKSDNAHELNMAIETVMTGKNFMSQRISRTLIPFFIDLVQGKQTEDNDSEISVREKEILSLVLEGYSSKQIGEMLHISARTVDTHRYNMMKKLGCSNTVELFKCAIKKKLV